MTICDKIVSGKWLHKSRIKVHFWDTLCLQHRFCNYSHAGVQNDHSYRPNTLKYAKTYIIKSSLFGGPVMMLHNTGCLELQITTDLSGHTDLAYQQKVGKMRCTGTLHFGSCNQYQVRTALIEWQIWPLHRCVITSTEAEGGHFKHVL
jgi:hypothetical protein